MFQTKAQNKITLMFYVQKTCLIKLPFFDIIILKTAKAAEVFSVHKFPNLYLQQSTTLFQPCDS